MKIAHYDKTTKQLLAWYDKDINSLIPTPNIEVSDEVWQDAVNNHRNFVDVEAKTLSTMDFRTIKEAKASKINKINTFCETEIMNGFASSALGSEKHYQSEQIDQLNLIGVVAGGVDDYFKCGIEDVDFETNGIIKWGYESHTIAQLKQVLNDGKVIKQRLLQKALERKASVDTASTVAEVDAITW